MSVIVAPTVIGFFASPLSEFSPCGVSVTVSRPLPPAMVRKSSNVCHFGNPHRDAVPGADHDLPDLVRASHLARRPDQVLLAISFDIASADVGIVRRQRGHDIAEAELVGHQLRRIRKHMELPFKAANGVHLDDTGHVRLACIPRRRLCALPVLLRP